MYSSQYGKVFIYYALSSHLRENVELTKTGYFI